MYAFSNELVKKATYRKSVIILEFNEDMQVEKQEHSYLNKINYLLQVGRKYFFLSKKVKIEIIKKGFTIKIVFPKIFIDKLKGINNIYLGYEYKNKFFYIESSRGIIHNILRPIKLEKEIEILNIEDGIAEILNENTLRYTYTGNNKFYYVKLKDFYLKKSDKEYYPKLIKKEKNKIIYMFDRSVFYEFNNNIFLNIVYNPKSKDMYGFSIKGNVKMKIKDIRETYVKSLSFSECKNRISYFKIYFSAPLNNFCDKDFLIQYNKTLYRCFYEKLNNEKNMVEVKVYNIRIENILKDKFKLILISGINNKIKTLDYKNRKIILKKEVISNTFISCAVDWIRRNHNINGSIIIICFQHYINPNTIITNSEFNESLNLWNGNEIQIPPKALIIENKDNLSKLTLKNNESFGMILINFVENRNLINKIIYNEKPCFLSLNCNKLSIKFNNYERNLVDFLTLKNIIYNPGKNIQDLNNNFIFNGYCPLKYEVSNNIVYIDPLQEETQNPFKGEEKNNNFIIKVSNNYKFRKYGIDEKKTVINGFIKIIGKLKPNQSIFLKNLKILDGIYLNVGEANIVFEDIECNNLTCE